MMSSTNSSPGSSSSSINKKWHGKSKYVWLDRLLAWIKKWYSAHPKTMAGICLGLICAVCYCSKRARHNEEESSFNDYDYKYSLTLANMEHVCPHRERAGTVGGDGGWWVCNEADYTNDSCVVYSYGIFDNFSFDHYFAATKKCEVHGFDPSPMGVVNQQAYEKVPKAHYHTYGLGSVDRVYQPNEVPFRWPGLDYLKSTNTLPWKLQRLATTMQELGHAQLTILKIDVEGAEWDSMHDIANAPWGELYLELHFPPNQYVVTRGTHDGAMIVTRTPAEIKQQRQSTLNADTARPMLARNSKPIDRLALLAEIDNVADMFFWESNSHCASSFKAECIEIYFKRRTTTERKSHPLDLVE